MKRWDEMTTEEIRAYWRRSAWRWCGWMAGAFFVSCAVGLMLGIAPAAVAFAFVLAVGVEAG